MRWLLGILVLIGAVVAAAWLGGETWAARQATQMIADDPRVQAASVTPLREPSRIGLHLADVAVETPQGPAALPALDLWAAPTSPNEFHATLPAEMTLPVAGTMRRVAAGGANLSLRVSPLNEMAVSRASAVSGPVTVDGAPLLSRLDAAAVLAPLGGASPRAARAAYEVTADLADLTPAGIVAGLPPALAQGGPLSASGAARLFLTGTIQPDGVPPRLVGLASDGVTLTLGDRALRLAGQVSAGADGLAEGAVFVDTADAAEWLRLAAELGMIPPAAVPLATTALATAAAATSDTPLPLGIIAPPPPAAGMLRLPLIFRDGKSFLGPVSLGPAPDFPK